MRIQYIGEISIILIKIDGQERTLKYLDNFEVSEEQGKKLLEQKTNFKIFEFKKDVYTDDEQTSKLTTNNADKKVIRKKSNN